MIFKTHNSEAISQPCDLLVVGMTQGSKRLSGVASAVDKALGGALTELVTTKAFDGKVGKRLSFPTFGKIPAREVVLLGCGPKETLTTDILRRLGGTVARLGRESKAKTIVTSVLGIEFGKIDARSSVEAFVEGILLGSYRFHTFKGAQHKKDDQPFDISTIILAGVEKKFVVIAKQSIERAQILAEATNFARDLVNTPSGDMAPLQLAAYAKKFVEPGSPISCTMLDQKTMEKMGMRAALAVARGSTHPPVGVHLVYKPRRSKKNIAIVGKAVTFDSGGLSLKPADAMMTMKIDMAGAASVLGLFKALAVLKPDVTVHGIFLAVENMPSGTAYRPGDVVTAMDGTTIEVLNTDAEGRVTLADALTFAVQQKPDMIIDLATLTGACVVALGEGIAGLMSNNAPLTKKLLQAADDTGEPLWQLPLFEPYTQLIKSKIADIKNIGGREAGAITAGLFLKTFVGKISWAHLDIAGPSYTEKETRPDQPYGASGYGVRLLAKFLEKV